MAGVWHRMMVHPGTLRGYYMTVSSGWGNCVEFDSDMRVERGLSGLVCWTCVALTRQAVQSQHRGFKVGSTASASGGGDCIGHVGQDAAGMFLSWRCLEECGGWGEGRDGM